MKVKNKNIFWFFQNNHLIKFYCTGIFILQRALSSTGTCTQRSANGLHISTMKGYCH